MISGQPAGLKDRMDQREFPTSHETEKPGHNRLVIGRWEELHCKLDSLDYHGGLQK